MGQVEGFTAPRTLFGNLSPNLSSGIVANLFPQNSWNFQGKKTEIPGIFRKIILGNGHLPVKMGRINDSHADQQRLICGNVSAGD